MQDEIKDPDLPTQETHSNQPEDPSVITDRFKSMQEEQSSEIASGSNPEVVNPLSSPAVEQWVSGLSPSAKDDEGKYEQLMEKWDQSDLTDQEHDDIAEITDRFDNDHLRKFLSAQVTDVLVNAADLVKDSKDEQILGQIVNTIQNGDLRAVYKGLSIRRQSARIALEPYRDIFDRRLPRPSSTSGSTNSSGFNPGVTRQEQYAVKRILEDQIVNLDATQDALVRKGVVQTQKGTDRPKVPSWSEIVANPQRPPQLEISSVT